MTDILADIDDTLADWNGSKDSMRWRPGGANEPEAAVSSPGFSSTVIDHVARIVETAWYDRSGGRITEEQADGERAAGRLVTFAEIHETEGGFRFMALRNIHDQPPVLSVQP